jgi:cyclomaltodextrinase
VVTKGDDGMAIKPGRYRHFKGNEYEVIGVARDSETEVEFVVYRALYGERGLWIRPLAMFTEHIERDGQRRPRFEYVGD